MSLRAALTALAGLPVPGVTLRAGIDDLPDRLALDQLPALLILPGDPYGARRAFDADDGLRALTFSGAASNLIVHITHALIVLPANAPFGQRRAVPRLVDRIDAYVAALAVDLTLGGALARPAHITIAPDTFTYGGVRWYGCLFRHTWALAP
ncbi:MAG: hypothetical protein NZM00_02435 [Anaerolinea sp.]|nr:hypothetical protein [Anaerolinea sp.]